MPPKLKTLWIISCFVIFFSYLFLSFQARVKEVRSQAEQERVQKLKEKADQAREKDNAVKQIKQIAKLNEEGKYSEAIDLARGVAERNPDNAEAFVWWGIALVKAGQKDEGLLKFVKASEINPRNPESYIYWGLTLSMMGKQDEAVQKYETAIKLDPENSNAHAYLGASLGQMGKNEQSQAQLELALKLDKLNVIAYNGLIDFYYDTKQYAKAWETVTRARNVNLKLSQDSIDRLARKMPDPAANYKP